MLTKYSVFDNRENISICLFLNDPYLSRPSSSWTRTSFVVSKQATNIKIGTWKFLQETIYFLGSKTWFLTYCFKLKEVYGIFNIENFWNVRHFEIVQHRILFFWTVVKVYIVNTSTKSALNILSTFKYIIFFFFVQTQNDWLSDNEAFMVYVYRHRFLALKWASEILLQFWSNSSSLYNECTIIAYERS